MVSAVLRAHDMMTRMRDGAAHSLRGAQCCSCWQQVCTVRAFRLVNQSLVTCSRRGARKVCERGRAPSEGLWARIQCGTGGTGGPCLGFWHGSYIVQVQEVRSLLESCLGLLGITMA